MFGTVYELSLNKQYVRHWGVLEAVRELIQNALDSDSPFVYSIDQEDDGAYTLVLTSEHSVLPVQSLLLGSTSKADSADKIGSFGEGYKIALLVLTREGRPTRVLNGKRCWTPFFRWSKMFEDEMLCIKDEANTLRTRGVEFLVSGLTAQEVEDIRESCLHMQREVGERKTVSAGEILLDKPGKLYVGGLFICKTELKYGYNIHPSRIRLERDRKTVDGFDLKMLTRDMWFETGLFERVAEMIEAQVPDVAYAEYHAPEMVKEACYKLFRSKHPGKLVAESAQDLAEKVRLGMTEYVYCGSALSAVVSRSASYRNEPRAPVLTPHARLQAWFDDARRHMHHTAAQTFRPLLERSRHWKE